MKSKNDVPKKFLRDIFFFVLAAVPQWDDIALPTVFYIPAASSCTAGGSYTPNGVFLQTKITRN
jgi:hypothetical protein